MSDSVKLALLHLNVLYGENRKNRENILSLAAKAADGGAKIIVSPEMGLSGYRYRDREAIKHRVEPADGPSAKAFAAFAKERGVFLVTGFGERDRATGMFHNSAFAFSPEGKLVSRYRKINAESRWACPGNPEDDNVFDTPWGKAGILICSDSYHSLPVRVTALRGASLVLLPANWPPTNEFPGSIWRFRALENGVWFAACNRTGKEEMFDCEDSVSHVFSPEGESLLAHEGPDSACPTVDIPLDEKGRFAGNEIREGILSRRRPWVYHRIYANLIFFRSITDTLGLPSPRGVDVRFFAPGPGENPVRFLEERLDTLYVDTLVALPHYPHSEEDLDALKGISLERKVIIMTARMENDLKTYLVIDGKDIARHPRPEDGFVDPVFAGPLVTRFCDAEELRHPEPMICAAKKGADLVLAIEENITPSDRLAVAIRPIDQVAAAFCAQNGAALGLVPEGHVTGRGAAAGPRADFSYNLDTRILRDKHFQDRVDFKLLCAGGGREEDRCE
ncbi:MAG: carbon-nitrogen hydrolase family protein [Deltaproteobacteria bacterium]|jgi:predicted amidohydrolase|nr:carbon-nitrogen hydrolase family protein [Deltaproteobacteria bacterium]